MHPRVRRGTPRAWLEGVQIRLAGESSAPWQAGQHCTGERACRGIGKGTGGGLRGLENGVELTIRGVRRDESGRKQRISAIGARCFSADGKALPMFHTHSDGNYQLSPTDIVTVFTRNAPFEGVQRGERYLVWEFASRLSRLVISIDTERANRRAAQP